MKVAWIIRQKARIYAAVESYTDDFARLTPAEATFMRPCDMRNERVLGALIFGLIASMSLARAEEMKLPVDSDDKRTVYVAPEVTSTGNTVVTNGATVGVQRPDGGTTYGGMNTAGDRPTYSVGASTGGDTSFSAGVASDGRKESAAVKAGVKIKF